MKRFTAFFIVTSLVSFSALKGQTASDDYWLNNGFTSGQTITTNSGTFYDDGGNSDYHADQDWNVTFCSENGNPITLDFSGFATDYRGPVPAGSNEYLLYDYLQIQYPGANYVAYNDDTPQFGFTSASGCIYFRFNSSATSLLAAGWSAEISANPPPANNDPCSATELNVGNACSPQYFSNKGAYSTTDLGNAPCHTFFGGDVWFTLLVPASGQVKIETFPGTLTYAILDIFSSSNCTITSSERIQCEDGAGSMPTVTLTGRTPGERIYIRLFGDQAKSGTFGICATDPTAPVTGYTGPGGVGDANSVDFWFKSDAGVLDASGNDALNGVGVMTWADQSGNGNDLVQAGSGQRPLMMESVVNGFGALKFDGSDDQFSLELGSKGAPVQWFSVGTFEGSARQTLISLGNADVSHTASISRHTDGTYFCLTQSDMYGPSLSGSQYYLFNARHKTTATRHNLRLNAASQTVTDYASALNTDGSLNVGASYLNTDFYNGYLPELIQYSKTLNTAQECIIENYLAAKYNLSLASNDLYSWKSTHKYDVAGIGRVDASNIHTKAASAGIMTIGGASDLGDNEFGFIGHNNGDFTTWTASGVPSGDADVRMLARTWRVINTGGDGIGTVTLGLIESGLPALPAGFSAYNILIDADGDFTSGAVSYGLIQSGSELVANGVSVSNGYYIAVAAVNPVISFESSSSSGLESVLHPQITVKLNYACSEVVEVNYTVTGGTATSGTDYSLVDGSITFNPGEKEKDIIPLIVNDTIPEIPDEYFDIEISSSSTGASVGSPSTHRYTILNDDLSADVSASVTNTGACTSSSATLYGSYEGTGPFTFSWSPAAGLSTTTNDTVIANPVVTTLYTFRVTDSFGQYREDTVTIFVDPLPDKPVIAASGATSFCEGDSVELSVTSVFMNYLWSDNSALATLKVKTSGTYSVTGIDDYGCSGPVSDPVVVTVNPVPAKPAISMTGTSEFCSYDSLILVGPEGFDIYKWNGVEGDDTLIVKSSGTYSLTVAYASGCESVASDAVSVTVHDAPAQPVITASGSTTFCEGDAVILGTSTAYDSYLWSNSAGTATIEVSASGIFTVTGTDSYGCSSPLSDPVTVTVNPVPVKPTLAMTGTTEFCSYDSLILVAPAGYDTYKWNGVEGDDTLIVKTGGTYSATVAYATGCESEASDAVTVTVHDAPLQPVITASGNTSFCEGDAVTLGTSISYDSYLWSNSANTATIEVSASGIFTVTAYNSFGCSSPLSEPVTITVGPLPAKPVISLTGTTEFCSYDSLILVAPAGYTVYRWNGIEGDDTLVVKTSGTYSATVAYATGCESEASDAVVVTVHDAPLQAVITASGNTSFCEGDAVTLGTSISYDSYLWSNSANTATIEVSASGIFTVTGTDSYGCSSPLSDPVTVTVSPIPAKPVIAMTGTTEFCSYDSLILVAPAGYPIYKWNGVEGDDTLIVRSSGTYSVTVDYTGCESEPSDEVTVTVHEIVDKPLITWNGNPDLCEGDSLLLEAPAGYAIYTWSDGTDTQSLYVHSADTYSVIVEDSYGCKSGSSDEINVIGHSKPATPIVTNIGSDEFCEGGYTDLQSSAGYTSWLWSNGETTESISVIETGDYNVIGIDAYGCSSDPSTDVSILVNPKPEKPVISYSTPLTFFYGDSVVLRSSPAEAYLWSPGNETIDSIIVKSSGDYSVQVEDVLGCVSDWSEPVTVVVKTNEDKPEINISGALEFCEGGSVTLTGPEGYPLYEWSNGENTNAITITESGTYTLVVTNDLGFESIPSDEIIVTVYPQPVLQIGEYGDPSCFDGTDGYIILTVTSGTSPFTFSWEQGGLSGDNVTGLEAGQYSVVLTDGNGCSASTAITLIEPEQLLLSSDVSDPFCPDIADGSIAVEVSGGTGTYTYEWSNNQSTAEITELLPGTYDLTVTDENGCKLMDSWTLDGTNETCFEIPEILTPNGDGYNDLWIIYGIEAYPETTIELFDRWGKRVYHSEGNQADPFDGTYNGKELPMESYHYIIDLHNGSERIIGNLTIIR